LKTNRLATLIGPHIVERFYSILVDGPFFGFSLFNFFLLSLLSDDQNLVAAKRKPLLLRRQAG
jgi:hypothetical protein